MTDFLSQVQGAEQKAATLLEKAVARKQSALRKYKTELTEAQKEKENIAQEEMKSSIQSARASARQSYETQVSAGEDEAQKLKTERGMSVKTTLPEAMNFFLELL